MTDSARGASAPSQATLPEYATWIYRLLKGPIMNQVVTGVAVGCEVEYQVQEQFTDVSFAIVCKNDAVLNPHRYYTRMNKLVRHENALSHIRDLLVKLNGGRLEIRIVVRVPAPRARGSAVGPAAAAAAGQLMIADSGK